EFRRVLFRSVDDVTISNCAFNLSGLENASGVLLDNVGRASIQTSSFGYTTFKRPALTLLNPPTDVVTRLIFGNGVFFATTDDTSEARITYCPACEETR